MKKIMMLGSIAAFSHAYRETGADFVELISHEDGCDYDELAANVKWKCQLDKLHRRRCQPENCEESIQMRCKCRKSGKCAWKQFTVKCTSKANDAKCQKLTDEWNCSRGSHEKSLCVGNCEGQSSIKRCSCDNGQCAWETRGKELNCRSGEYDQVNDSLAPMSREMNLGIRSVKKLPFAKVTPSEALLITSEGSTLANNLADIQENWVDFLIRLASFDKLTLISIDNGIMKE